MEGCRSRRGLKTIPKAERLPCIGTQVNVTSPFVDLHPDVLGPELIMFIAELLVFGLQLSDPDVSPLHQTSHKLSQRLQRKRVGILSHGQAELRHEGRIS